MLNRTGSGQKSAESILGQEGVFTLRWEGLVKRCV